VLAVSSPQRVAGVDAPTMRESGIALDLANWRAIVAPPGLSIAEQSAITERLTRLATSERWKATLRQNGWEDQFLTGMPLRQFLLAEQSRIEAVLLRLSASETTTARAMVLTPMTLPGSIAGLFIGALALVISRKAARLPQLSAQGLRMVLAIAIALLLLPLVFWTAGFIAASTGMFVVTASAMRGQRPTPRVAAIDLIVGAAFAIVLFLAFTSGLGVALPGPGFL
jgi:hypothetical protein